MTLVLDASVILKWFRAKDEDKIEKARDFEKKHLEGEVEIAIPELLFYEVANVLLTKPRIKAAEVLAALEILDRLNLKRFPNDASLQKIALKICQKTKISFYDASYAALAIFLKTRLVTADQKLAEKLGKEVVELL